MPIGPSSLAGIDQASFRLLTEETSTPVAPLFDGGTDQVALSSTGQLLSAVFSFRNRLEVLQANTPDPSQTTALSTAQTLVKTLDALQARLATLQSLFDSLTGTSPGESFVRTLSELRTTLIASINSNLDNLSDIGLRIQFTPSSDITSTNITLSIDQNALNAAVAADSASTQAVLAEVTQSLIDLTADFETQIAEATTLPPDLTPPDIPVAQETELIPILEADNGTATLTTTQTTGTVGTPEALPDQTLPTSATGTTGTLPATATATATTAAPTTTVNPDLATSQAALALQRLLAEPAIQATRNLFDPAYAGLIAASRLGDFVSPDRAINPIATGVPALISPIDPSHSIAYYNETSEDTRKRLAIYVDNRI
jgi:hypothetical protein